MSGCGCCIEVETPQSILDDDNLDVFSVILTNYGTYKQTCSDYLWEMYRYRMLGSCDRNRWIQAAKDRADFLLHKYGVIFDGITGADLSIIEAGGYVMTTESQSEDLPQTTADATEYLSDRGRVVQTYDPLNIPPWEAAKNLADGFVDPFQRFALEFESLFLMAAPEC